jgi:hypothetical protein
MLFYVHLDAQYVEWYLWKFGIALDRDLVLPVLHALQVHPDPGSLWAELIVEILESMDFKKTCHEPCLCAGVFKGQ